MKLDNGISIYVWFRFVSGYCTTAFTNQSSLDSFIWFEPQTLLTYLYPITEQMKIMGTSRVNEGQMIRVICNLTGGVISEQMISWFINGLPYSVNLSSTITVRDFPMASKGYFLSEIYVRDAQLSNQGVYACRGTQGARQEFNVEVLATGSSQEVKVIME